MQARHYDLTVFGGGNAISTAIQCGPKGHAGSACRKRTAGRHLSAGASQSNLPQQNGALVAEVTPGSPGERAGLKPGDIVTEFGGNPVADSRHLQLLVARKPPGSQVSIKIVRDGKDQTLTVQLGELPPQSPSQAQARESDEN